MAPSAFTQFCKRFRRWIPPAPSPIDDHQRGPDEDGEPETGGRVTHAGRGDERDRDRLPAAQKHRDGGDADAERQHACLEVRFERVDARARDVMSQRHERAEGNREPRGWIELSAEQHDADPDRRHRDEIRREEQRFERRARGAPDRGHDVVEEQS